MVPPARPDPRPGQAPPHALPVVDIAERVGEVVHPVEILLLVARLGDQQADLDQGEDDAAEVLGPRDAPVRQHVRREQPELLAREVAAGPGQLGAA